jgi:hypothetical protein
MNNTRRSTPPNTNFDFPNRSTDLKTLGIVGTPHEESIAKILPTKTCQIKRNRRNPAKSSSNPRTPKTPKSSPLTHGFGRGMKGKRTTKGSHKFPPSNPQEQGPENTPRKPPREGSKSSIHTKEVHTRSSLPPDHPTLSQNLTMKLSRYFYGNPKKIGRENWKADELGFQEIWLPSSHLMGYMEATESLKYPYLITRDTSPSRAVLEVFDFLHQTDARRLHFA